MAQFAGAALLGAAKNPTQLQGFKGSATFPNCLRRFPADTNPVTGSGNGPRWTTPLVVQKTCSNGVTPQVGAWPTNSNKDRNNNEQ